MTRAAETVLGALKLPDCAPQLSLPQVGNGEAPSWQVWEFPCGLLISAELACERHPGSELFTRAHQRHHDGGHSSLVGGWPLVAHVDEHGVIDAVWCDCPEDVSPTPAMVGALWREGVGR